MTATIFSEISFMDIILVIMFLACAFAIFKFYHMIRPAANVIKNDANRYSVKEDSVYNVVIQKIICKLKLDLHATKIVIGRFHNGGNYVNGLPMKKFTLTHETAGGTDIPMMDKCVAVLNSRYSVAFAQLATIDSYCISDINDCNDMNFQRDMRMYGYKATYLFLMRQFDGKEDGFIGVNFNHTEVLMKEQRHLVEEQIPRIIGLLNMQIHFLKGDE
jgi:hypothetical protein